MKKYLTMWQVWAVVSVLLAVMLVFKNNDLRGLLPFAVFLICPLMMIFMMGSHGSHKK